MKLHRILLLIAIIATTTGLAGFAPLTYFWYENRTALAESDSTPIVPAQEPVPDPTRITGKPASLSIPSLGIDLRVADGAYNTETAAWTLSNDKAHFALPSTQPNNLEGNTFLYGHYRRTVFAQLHKISPGAEVHLTTDNGHRFIYAYRENSTVDPTNADIFAYEGPPQLTIQTCSGTWFQNRQLFFFDLKQVL